MNRLLLLAFITISLNSFADDMEKPLKVDLCTVAENPQLYDGKMIEINASQIRLKKNEWGLDGDICLPVFLLVLPLEVSPMPKFTHERTSAFDELFSVRGERATFRANFIGRFDWAGTDKKKLFGRSKQSMRLVLKSVSNPMKIMLPYK